MHLSELKIAFFVIDYTSTGGVERVTADLSKIFVQQHLWVLNIVSLYQSNPQPKFEYAENVDFVVLHPKNKSDFQNVFENYFQDYKPDIFIFQGDNMTISLKILKAAKKSNVTAIPVYHGSPFAYLKKYPEAKNSNALKIMFSKMQYPFKKNKLGNFLQQAEKGVVCVSKGSAEELKSLFPCKNFVKNISVLWNPIELKESSLINKEKTVSFVSRLESKHKNAFLSVKAWKEIHEKFPDWTLKIYGTGSLSQKMKQFCNAENIKNVEFLGFVENINAELAKSSISISTSNSEGFSIAIAEAIANHNAIAITDSDGGVSDMVIAKKTGLVSPKNNEKELANNIYLLITNENLRKQLAENAYQHLKEKTTTNIFDEWKNLLLSTL